VDERLAKLAAEAGLVTVQYDIASGDPDPGLSAKRIARSVVNGAKGGSIVVFHMNRNGARTAEALPEIIAGLREKGFELVTVGEMLKKTDTETRGQGDTGTKGTGTGSTAATAKTRETATSQGTANGDALSSETEHTGLTGSGLGQ